MTFRRLAVSGIALAAAVPAFSQTYDLGTITLETETGGVVGNAVDLSTGSLMRFGGEIAETPRSVSIVTGQEIHERGAEDVEEALRYTTGVSPGQYGLDDRSDWYTIRGFSPTTFHDRLQARYGYYNDVKPETFLLDSIEVLRGPASGAYGNGEVGGIVNTKSKSAADWRGDNLVRLSFGDPRSAELGLDFGGDLGETGSLTWRVVGLLREATTQVDFSDDDAVAIAPSITWRPTADTELTLLYNHQKNDGSPLIQFASIYGTLYEAPNGRYLDDDLFVGEPSFDRFDAERDSLTLFADHRFDESWSVSGRARWLDAKAAYDHAWWAFDDYPTRYNDDGTIDRTVYSAENSLQTFTADAYATADWQAGGWDVTTIAGASYADSDYDSDTGYGAQIGPIDPFDPVYSGVTAFDIVDSPSSRVEEIGLYLQNKAVLNDRLHLDFGLRWGRIETEEGAATFSDDAVVASDDAVTGNLSVLYAFENGFAPYASYAESFRQEEVGEDAFGNAFDPTRGEQYEIGMKYQPRGTENLYTLAAFNLEKSNLTQADPENPGFQRQTGEASSQGIEMGAQSRIGDFRIDVNATFLDTDNVDGYEIATVPDRFGSLWVTWEPSAGRLAGLSAGLGLRHTGGKWDGTDTQRTPSNTLFDARLAYGFDRYEVALNVSNIEDDRYMSFCGTGECYFGESREVSLSLAARF